MGLSRKSGPVYGSKSVLAHFSASGATSSGASTALIASWTLTTKTLLRAWTAWCAFDALTAWALAFALVAA